MKSFAVVAIIAAALAAPAFGADPDEGDPGAGQSVEQSRADEQELVCRSEPVSGSNIRKRVCRTRGSIREAREASQRYMQEFHGSGAVNNPGPRSG